MSEVEKQKIKDMLHIEESKPRRRPYNKIVWLTEDGKKHRIYGPAVIGDGYVMYFVNDKLHRTDGPAFESDSGYFEYAIDGVTHKEDGPAKFCQEKDRYEYWINGVLHRDGGPAIYYPKSTSYMYYKQGLLHRVDGPAKYSAYSQETSYYQFGVLHREDGPAVIRLKSYTNYYEKAATGNGPVEHKAGEEYWLGGNKVSEEFFWRFHGKK
jgi:hypothetical protein